MAYKKILIVQPDDKQRLRVVQMLEEMGHSCRPANSGEDALEKFKTKGPFNLVVLEPSLPDMEGMLFLAELRKLASPNDCAVVVLTAYPHMMTTALRMKRELGIASVLSLKSTAVSLTGVLDNVLKGKAVEDERLLLPNKPLVILPADTFQKQAKERDAKRLARIAALRLGTELPVEEALQSLVSETAGAFEFPVCLLSLNQGERSYFKVSTAAGRMTGEESGDWVQLTGLLQAPNLQPVSVVDAGKDPGLSNMPLVISGEMGCYYCAPILRGDGTQVGNMALVDRQPRIFKGQDLDLFVAVARRVGGEIELAQNLLNMKKEISLEHGRAQEQEDRLSMLKEVLESLQLGVLLHDSKGQVVLANSRLQELTGLERDQIQGSSSELFQDEMLSLFDDPDHFKHKIKVLADGPYNANEIFETQRPRRQVLRWTTRPFFVGSEWYQLSTYEDITASVDLAAQQEKLVSIDFVTGLLNRRGIQEEAAREAERARRKKRHYSMVLFYLHGLEELNETKSWAAGDAALKAVGERIQASLRLMDRPARWSGRHFMVLLPETGEADARMVAGRMAEGVKRLELAVPLFVSGGVAYSEDSSSLLSILEIAETRLRMARNTEPGAVL